ncbi:MAG: hypothetical protein SGPRY_014783, partial [Prymnesium sp.]
MAEPAIEKHQESEVSVLQSSLRSLAPQINAAMPRAVLCALAPDDSGVLPPQTKRVHFIRHGEGDHNVIQREWRASASWDGVSEPYTIDNDPSFTYLDPGLTPKGKSQAEALQPRASRLSTELLVTSPMRRAMQTALIAFSSASCSPAVIATDLCHEVGGKHTCDKRRAISELRAEFPGVDYSEILEEEDPLWLDGLTRESLENLSTRAARFAEWLMKRPEKEIAVASHSAFLLAIFNAVFTTDDEETRRWF